MSKRRALGCLVLSCLSAVILVAGCGGGGGGGGGGDGAVDNSGNVPLASAGVDQNVSTGSLVSLDGSLSSDPQGELLSYFWSILSKPDGSSAAISDPAAAKSSFTVDVDGDYSIALVVNDGVYDSLEAIVTVTATTVNAAPVANAGADQSVASGATVALDGSTSSDADLDNLTFAWAFVTKPETSTVTLSSATAVQPSFNPDLAGEYVLSLVVNDGTEDSVADTVTVTVATPAGNAAPVAHAGVDQSVNSGHLVTLDATGSSDADGDILSYGWTLVSRPPGSAADLSDTTAAQPIFTADEVGDYVFRLIVNDGSEASAAATVTVTAYLNAPPVANAGINQTVAIVSTVTLNGTGSTDAEGDPLTYSWSFTSKPAASTATLSDPTAAQPTFSADVVGDYVVQLIVNDGAVGSAADTATIQALGSRVKWFVPFNDIRGTLDAAPTVGANGQVYAKDANSVCSINPADGIEDWAYTVALYPFTDPAPTTIISAQATNYVYAGFEDGKVRGFTADTGTKYWTFSTGGTQVTEVAVSSLGLLYFGANDGKLYMFEPKTGGARWTYQTGGMPSAPVVAPDETVYFGSEDKNFYALDATGALKWTIAFAGGIFEKPLRGSDGTIYVVGTYSSASKKELVAINPDGTVKWSFGAVPSLSGVPAVASNGTVYVVSEDSLLGGLYAVNADGSQKWLFQTGVLTHGSPVLASGDSILLAAEDILYSLSAGMMEDWRFIDFSGTVIGSPAVGADGIIYITTTWNRLYALYGLN